MGELLNLETIENRISEELYRRTGELWVSFEELPKPNDESAEAFEKRRQADARMDYILGYAQDGTNESERLVTYTHPAMTRVFRRVSDTQYSEVSPLVYDGVSSKAFLGSEYFYAPDGTRVVANGAVGIAQQVGLGLLNLQTISEQDRAEYLRIYNEKTIPMLEQHLAQAAILSDYPNRVAQ